jgi:hypothetical protein
LDFDVAIFASFFLEHFSNDDLMKKNDTFPPGWQPSYWAKFPSQFLQRIPLFILAFCGLVNGLHAQSLTFNSSGTFIVPPGVTSITVQAWGAGGGSAGGGIGGRAGGGGGAFATKIIAVTPGTSYTVTVGSGGAPGSTGGNSSFGVEVIAVGGSNGSGLTGGNGGLASACTPTVGAFLSCAKLLKEASTRPTMSIFIFMFKNFTKAIIRNRAIN